VRSHRSSEAYSQPPWHRTLPSDCFMAAPPSTAEQITSPFRVVTHWPLPQSVSALLVRTMDPNLTCAQYTSPLTSLRQGPPPQMTSPERSFRQSATTQAGSDRLIASPRASAASF